LNKSAARAITIAFLLTLFYCISISFGLLPGLRGPDEWRWARAIPGTLKRLWLPGLSLMFYVMAAIQIKRISPRKRQVVSIALAMIFVPLIQLTLLYMDHPDVRSQLFYRTVSEEAGGFFNAGIAADDSRSFLENYAGQMETFPVHPQRHPPVLSLLFLLTRDWLSGQPELALRIANEFRPFQCHNLSLMSLGSAAIASAVIQMLVPLFLVLLVPLLHYLTRSHYDEDLANKVVLIFPLVPSVALWATRWNHLYGILSLFCLIFLHLGLTHKRPLWLFMTGITISLGSFFSFGNLTLVGFVGCYSLVWLYLHRDDLRPKWHLVGLMSSVLGLASLWLLALIFNVNLVTILRTSLSLHYGLGRTYLLWLGYHLYDFFVFLGIPIAVLWFWRLKQVWSPRQLDKKDILFISFSAGLLLLDLSGTSQGEVARVWAFLIPIALASVARLLANDKLYAGVLLLLAVQVFVSNVFLRLVSTGLSDPPLPPEQVMWDKPIDPVLWQEGPSLADASIAYSGELVHVEAIWTTTQQIDRPYTIFLHAVGEDGTLIAQSDGQPRNGQWPTSCWRPGEYFLDEYELAIPEGIPVDSLELSLGFYWLPTGERLTTVEEQLDMIVLE